MLDDETDLTALHRWIPRLHFHRSTPAFPSTWPTPRRRAMPTVDRRLARPPGPAARPYPALDATMPLYTERPGGRPKVLGGIVSRVIGPLLLHRHDGAAAVWD